MSSQRTLDSEFAERLRHVYNLPRSPKTLNEYGELVRERGDSSHELQAYVERVQTGEVAIGACDAAQHYAVVSPENGEVKVMCGYDTLMTNILRGGGLSRGWCVHCGELVEVEISGQQVTRLSSPEVVFWLGAGPVGAPGNPVCDHLHIFPNQTHLEGWLETQPDELGVALPIGEAVEFFAGMYASAKSKPDSSRPAVTSR